MMLHDNKIFKNLEDIIIKYIENKTEVNSTNLYTEK